jgi:WD40 repeat protein
MRWSWVTGIIALALVCVIVSLIWWYVSVRQSNAVRQKANDVGATLLDRGFTSVVQEARAPVAFSSVLTVSSDGRLVASNGIDFRDTGYHQPGIGIINLWQIDNPASYRMLRLSELGNDFRQICFAHHNTRLYACTASSIIIWDLSTLKIERTIDFSRGIVNTLCLSPDCTRAALSRPSQVDVYRVSDTSVICSLPSKPCNRLLFSPDGQTLAAITQTEGESGESGVKNHSGDGAGIVIWSLTQKGPPVRLGGNDPYFLSFCFSPDGSELAGGSVLGHVYIWDTTRTRQHVTISETSGVVTIIEGIAFSSQGNLIALGKSRDTSYIEVYERERNMRMSTIHCGLGTLTSVAFIPGSDNIAGVFGEGFVRVWTTRAYKNAEY